MPPTERNLLPPASLPDLSGLSPHGSRMAMRRLFQQGGAREHTAYVLQLNAVRLADSALAEYELARAQIAAFHGERKGAGIRYILRASGHFESCIWAIERFIKHAKAIRSRTFAASDLGPLIPKSSCFLQSTAERSITRVRHCLAHLEKNALAGQLPQGSNLALLALDEGLSIGSHTIAWPELIAWLTDVHSCASSLADYVPPPTP